MDCVGPSQSFVKMFGPGLSWFQIFEELFYSMVQEFLQEPGPDPIFDCGSLI